MKDLEMLPVKPVKPVAGYIGGKRNLAGRLVERIGAIPHGCYVEPFVGMGGVFFRRTARPRAEIINDISRDVTTLFRLLQRHFQQLLDVLKWQVTSREDFERLVRVDADTLTDLERAARFLYLQRLSYGGNVGKRYFGTDVTSSARFDLTKLVSVLEAVHDRLTSVVIECKPYEELIVKYDRPGTLFYLDPPYHGSEDYYGKGLFAEVDFERLSGLLKGLQGHFILSLNDTPLIRELFAWAHIESVVHSFRFNGVTPANELIISPRLSKE
ncbi:MAG: DNA adenine methylase [Sphingobium sp.]|nr:DNA adenine methylase [Sphingobium sp.]